jgi:hypothetical protein
MNSESNIDPKELSACLVRLENRNKLLMRWNLLLVAIVCSMLFIGWKSYAQPTISEWVDCRGISVKDAGGRTRAMLSVKGNETIMQFYDATGKVTWSAPSRIGIKPIGK